MPNMVYNPHERRKRGAPKPPFLYIKMISIQEILIIVKFIACITITIGIFMAPAWVARQNGKGKPQMQHVRLASWVFGWSVIGWIWAMYWATKK